jgi:hypothetical protein
MTSVNSNSFGILSAVKTKKNEMITQQSNSDETNSSSTSTVDESSWTVQSTKRRLIPQWTLSRQDMGVDSQKNKNAQSEKPASNETKKKGDSQSYIIIS